MIDVARFGKRPGDATHYHENRIAQADRVDSMYSKSIEYNASVAWLQSLSKLFIVQNNHDGAKIALNIVDYINELEDNTAGYVTTIETLARKRAEALAKITALEARVPVVCDKCDGNMFILADRYDIIGRDCPNCIHGGESTGATWKDGET